ncbi:MAG: hypothetical protein K2H14_00440 [Muribaculaceae bacterium]|nr:hypothetical protein [Muribaculaceae bacterium]
METLNAVIGIFGLTTEGLKAAVGYARKGFRVLCMDFRDFKVEMVNRGISFSGSVSDMELLRLVKSGKIKATTDAGAVREMDFLTIFPTPRASVDRTENWLRSILEAVSANIKPGVIIGLDNENETMIRHTEMERIMKRSGHTYGIDYLFGTFQPSQE